MHDFVRDKFAQHSLRLEHECFPFCYVVNEGNINNNLVQWLILKVGSLINNNLVFLKYLNKYEIYFSKKLGENYNSV